MPGTYPAVEVSFAWGVASSDVPTALEWVDESAYVDSLDIKHGGEDEFSQPGAGTLELTLDNSTGRFDPDNASGALYGDLQPLTWVRVRGGDSSVDTGVFYGQVSIDGFRLAASQFTGQMVVSVTVLDMLEQLANTDLPGSVHQIEMEALSPAAWWRLGETAGSVAADSSGNGHHGTYDGGATFYSRSGLVANDDDNAIEFATAGVSAAVPPVLSAYPFTVHAKFETTTDVLVATHTARTIYQANSYAGDIGLGLWPDDDSDAGRLFFYVTYFGLQRGFTTTAEFNDGETHTVVAVANSAADFDLYVDGEAVATSALGTDSPTMTAMSAARIGEGVPPTSMQTSFGGVIDEVAVFDVALSSPEAAALYAAGTTPWEGELTSDRATHLLDAVDFPASLRTIDTGQSTMPSASLATDALSALQETVKAEGGDLYADHHDDGKLRIRDRHSKWTDTRSLTSQATFGDGSGEVTYSAVDIQDDRIINYAAVQRANGATMVAQDAASMTQYQRRTLSESGLLIETDAEAQHRANLIVAEKKDRHRRVRSVTLEPAASTHPAWAQVFAREIGDRVTVKWRPPYGGTYSFDSWIIGISHSWRPADDKPWRTTLYLEPVPYGATAEPYFIVGVSEIESDARIGY